MVISYPSKTTALEISISYFYLGLFIGLTGITVFHALQIGETIRGLKNANSSVGR
jgi:TRAP-type C4-dicarboxylate transport system permease small subunit